MKRDKLAWLLATVVLGSAVGYELFSKDKPEPAHPAHVNCQYLGETVFFGNVENYYFDSTGHLVITKAGVGVVTISNIPCVVQEIDQ